MPKKQVKNNNLKQLYQRNDHPKYARAAILAIIVICIQSCFDVNVEFKYKIDDYANYKHEFD